MVHCKQNDGVSTETIHREGGEVATGMASESFESSGSRDLLSGRFPAAFQKEHCSLLRRLDDEPIVDAAYLGSGADAATLLLVANPAHAWLVERISLFASTGDQGYWSVLTAEDQAQSLRDALQAGQISAFDSGFFSYEMAHTRKLGEKLLGNLCFVGATDFDVVARNKSVVEISFSWQHPNDTAPMRRTLSFVHCPPDSDRSLAKLVPALDFFMTRGFNNDGAATPEVGVLSHKMKLGRYAFLDFHDAFPVVYGSTGRLPLDPIIWEESQLQRYGVSESWSQHGKLRVYQRDSAGKLEKLRSLLK